MKRMAYALVAILALCACVSAATPDHQDLSAVGAEEALLLLKTGNKAFVAGGSQEPGRAAVRMKAVAAKQHPFAAVLGCSDSRVPVEIIFDRGIGDLFVVRDAGNIAGDYEIASLEYAAEHLGVGLIVVLGHKRCGAVEAAVDGTRLEGHINDVLARIAPAVAEAQGAAGDTVERAVKANVRMVCGQLAYTEPVLSRLVAEKKLKIVGAYYDLDTGAVEFLSDTGE